MCDGRSWGTQQPRIDFARERGPVRSGLCFKGEIKSRGPWKLLLLQNSGIVLLAGHWARPASVVPLGSFLGPGPLMVCWPVAYQALCATAFSSSIQVQLTVNRDSCGLPQLLWQLQSVPATTCHISVRYSPQLFPLCDPSGREVSQPEGTHYPLHCEAPGSPIQCH